MPPGPFPEHSTPPQYTFELVTMEGTVLTTFDANIFTLEDVTYTLNEADNANFSFPKSAIASGAIDVLATAGDAAEIRIWQNPPDYDAQAGQMLAWGPIVSMSTSGDDPEVHCHMEGVDWYLFRRFLDGTVTEYLTNVEFEDDFTDWHDWNGDDAGTSSSAGYFSISTDTVFMGDKSARLDALPGGTEFVTDNFIEQDFAVTIGGIGLAIQVSAWYYIRSSSSHPYLAALDGRGLYIEVRDSDDNLVVNNFFVLDSATLADQWQKAQCHVFVNVPGDYTVKRRLYAGAQGTVFWDDTKSTRFDSTGYVDITADTDTAVDVGLLIPHLVDRLQQTGIGKSDVHIDTSAEGYTPPVVGKKVTKTYQFYEHVQFDQALEEYVNQDDGVDYGVTYNPFFDPDTSPDPRRFFFTVHPKRGNDYTIFDDPAFSVEFHAGGAVGDSNVLNYRWSKDGANCITRQTVLGEDNGPNREESEVTDATDVDGIILQDVRQAPQDTEVKSLEGIAQARLNLFKTPPIVLEVDIDPDYVGSNGIAVAAPIDDPVYPDNYGPRYLNNGKLISIFQPGDFVPVIIDDGFVQVDRNLRLHQMKLNGKTNVWTYFFVVDDLN